MLAVWAQWLLLILGVIFFPGIFFCKSVGRIGPAGAAVAGVCIQTDGVDTAAVVLAAEGKVNLTVGIEITKSNHVVPAVIGQACTGFSE